MRRGLHGCIDEIKSQTSFANAIRLATVLAVWQTLVTFEMALSAGQTSCSYALWLVRSGGWLWRSIAIGLRYCHETELAVQT